MGGLWRRAIFVRVGDVFVEGRGLGGRLSFLFVRRLGGTKDSAYQEESQDS
jgi:hypothetical protein